MKVVKNSIVTLKYSVTDPDGAMVDDGQEPLIYLHGGHDDIFPKIEEALEGKELNETVKVRLQADEAFGEYDAELVQIESRADLPEELELGMELEGGPEDGGEGDDDFVIYRVTEIDGDKVVLDGNHPLAGKPLVFTCTVAAVRPASKEEVARGSASED
ncbi:MAG TPA: peptidylprolyl isomerase [Zoogloea sp.]|jgi:FKBP-type peptidyl-prolyl cis-trans isomerase SlyD|uniref:FKBP-type peptidyl-prolyl cis-trans isomerase n=1 Tax=Zoogloea sp. TaxID=49181 RepID=UPI001B6EE2BE|nr:FKBP-type peptidyl-prolyl cis-trans isomerase [Zoogloea sp.]MBP8265733.1 FKBP-type peptidyl-prolyl cis-trans isomerase [Zoogloea sp.]HOB45888.1 peptidylprolyl isomerase [Zoogloea sp.]HQA10488.1 peptidylprolyl isomerase [Zoogloea sp.]HQE38054.1 peptidylprolyl isomerase [Zoogloea sp.]